MPLLYYWRPDNHQHDLDFGVGFHLNQGTPRLHDIEVGDNLWAFTCPVPGFSPSTCLRVPPSWRLGENGPTASRWL